MQKLTRANKDYSKNAKVAQLWSEFVVELNNEILAEAKATGQVAFGLGRWGAEQKKVGKVYMNVLKTDNFGSLPLISYRRDEEDYGMDYGLEIWEDESGDIFWVMSSELGDETWSNTSRNGRSYYVHGETGVPVVITD